MSCFKCCIRKKNHCWFWLLESLSCFSILKLVVCFLSFFLFFLLLLFFSFIGKMLSMKSKITDICVHSIQISQRLTFCQTFPRFLRQTNKQNCKFSPLDASTVTTEAVACPVNASHGRWQHPRSYLPHPGRARSSSLGCSQALWGENSLGVAKI